MGKLEDTALTRTPDESRMPVQARPKPGRLFYSGAAALVLVLMLLGFQQYYLCGKGFPGRDIAPPMQTLVFVHAIAMTTWVVLFLVQPLLIAYGSRRVHMAVGRFGAVLAACVVVLGSWVAIRGAWSRLTCWFGGSQTLTPGNGLRRRYSERCGPWEAVGVAEARRTSRCT